MKREKPFPSSEQAAVLDLLSRVSAKVMHAEARVLNMGP